MVGNSLTVDSELGALSQLASVIGRSLAPGWHYQSGQSLEYIVANPSFASGSSPDTWSDALSAAEYDYLTLQPFPVTNSAPLDESTLLDDEASAKTLIDAAAGTPEVWIYCAWPARANLANWADAVTDADATVTIRRRQYYEHLRDRLVADSYCKLLKIGHVFVNVANRLDANEAPGYDSGDMYRDPLHASDLGSYVVGCTIVATFLDRIPSAPFPTANYGSGYTAALQTVIDTAIREELATP